MFVSGMFSWIALATTVALGLLLWYCYRRLRDKDAGKLTHLILLGWYILTLDSIDNPPQQTISGEGSSHQVLSGRMRKRDIVRYYGRRMIRKVTKVRILCM